MPTFIAYKKGEKIDSVTGAVPAKLVVSVLFLPTNSSPTSTHGDWLVTCHAPPNLRPC